MSTDAPGDPPVGWLLIHSDGAVAAADDVVCLFAGMTSSAAITGQAWHALINPGDIDAALATERARLAGTRWHGRLRLARPQQAPMIVDAALAPSADGMSTMRLQAVTASGTPAAPGDVRSAAREALDALRQRTPFDWAAVVRFDRDESTIEDRATHEDGERRRATVVAVYPEPLAGIGDGVAWSDLAAGERDVIASGQPAIHSLDPDSPDDTSPLRRLAAYGMRWSLRIPLFTTRDFAADGAWAVAGCVVLYRAAPPPFDAADGLHAEHLLAGLGERLVERLDAPLDGSATDSPVPPGEAEPADDVSDAARHLAMLGEIVAGVAHELNNPLTTILGYAQLLEALDPAEQREALRTIEHEAQRAAETVHNLLSFARRGERVEQAVDLTTVVRRAVEKRRYRLEVARIVVETEFQPVPLIIGDPWQLEDVMLNLLANAQEALAPRGGGVVSVTTTRVHGRARVLIADNGPGVPPEQRARIFEPFYTAREVGEARGMGLATAYGVVAEHRGRLWVEETPGGGATLVLDFPAASPTEAAVQAAPPAGAHRSVLVVDDEAPVRALTREILGSAGYRVETAASGPEAIEHLDRDACDLVIADLHMPGMNGAELYDTIAHRWPDLRSRVVFITGDSTMRMQPATAPAAPTIEKPFDTATLLQVTREVLEREPAPAAGDKPPR